MIDFKLLKIKLFNFGCYYGENEINFQSEKDKNIFLFRLPNGYGKTTLFHAIKWGFYGESIPYFKDSSPVGLKDFLNNKLNPGKDLCFVQIFFEYSGNSYVLKRVYKPSTDSKSSSVSLVKSGREIVDNIKINEELEQILPKNFSDFFMFDGEQLSRFMSAQDKIYEDSIHQLLGLKQLRILKEDLKKLQKKYENEIVQLRTNDDEFKKNQGLITGIHREIQTFDIKISNLQSEVEKDEIVKDGLQEHRSAYENLPNVMIQLQQVLSDESVLNSKIAVIENELQTHSQEFFVNFIKKDLKDFISKNQEDISDLKDACGLTDNQAETQKIKEDILAKSIPVCNVCNHPLSESEINKLKAEQKRLKEAIGIFQLNREKRDELIWENNLFNNYLNLITGFDFQKKLDDLEELRISKEQLISKKIELQKESEKSKYGELSKINRQISSIESENATRKANIDLHTKQIKALNSNIEEIKRNLKRLGHDDKMTQKIVDLSDYVSKMIKLLEEVLEKCTESKRNKIIKKSNELFLAITNKPLEYKDIEFKDGDSYSFVIRTFDGKIVINPSKGEKQVLAMSFLLGLNQYTGINNVILMDTPVATLDDIHSGGIGKALSQLKNQVIFLAQPQELNGEIYNNMKSSISKEFTVDRKDYGSVIKEVKNER